MTRDSVNITLSEPLRRAQIKPRLEALAQLTGLAPTQLAGRALTIGLEIIEVEPSRIFPGVPAQSASGATAAPAVATASEAPPSSAGRCHAQQCEATLRPDSEGTAAPSPAEPETTPSQDAASARAPLPDEETTGTRPRKNKSGPVSTQDAARALGYRAPSGFTQHVGRHRELRRCGRKMGRAWTWDLAKLRAEYERKGWVPK